MKTFQMKMVCLLAISLLIYACTPKNLGVLTETQVDISPYSLPPITETFIYHVSDDSSEVHLTLPVEKLLSSRKTGEADFLGKLKVYFTVTAQGKSTPQDTITYEVYAELKNEAKDGVLYHTKRFPLPAGEDYKLDFTFTDQTRNTAFYSVYRTNKKNSLDRGNFIFKKKGNMVPYFSNFLIPNYDIQVISDRVDLTSLNYYRKAADLTLPPPPSSSSKNRLPEFTSYNLFNPLASKDTLVFNQLEVSDLFITKDSGSGLTMLVRPEGFPEPSSIYELVQPLRYISSRKEFEKMEGSSNLKLGLDNFWLNCGDSKERSKELIAIFYSRVEESNRFFTSYKSGWRTDRGLINIVFGAPTDLEITSEYELWTYGDRSDLGSIQFKFNKVENDFTTNYFELERNPIYKSEWARRVGAWRNGRIYN